MRRLLVLLSVLVVGMPTAEAAGVLRRVAGRGTEGFSGDGGPARDAEFGRWLDIAIGASGNVFVADTFNHRVRRIDAETGKVDTLAGTGERGFGGDDGPASQASLGRIRGIAVDQRENVYVADTENYRVRRIGRDGVITTAAGGDKPVPRVLSDVWDTLAGRIEDASVLACDGHGMVYIGGWISAYVWRIDPSRSLLWRLTGNGEAVSAGDGGPAKKASVGGWVALAGNRLGDLFIAERDHHRVRKVRLRDGIIRRVAGTGIAGFSGDGGPATEARLSSPTAVAVDGAGNLYIADRDAHRIRRVDAEDGTIATIAGNGDGECAGGEGPALATAICPDRIAVDTKGNVYFTDGRMVPVIMRLETTP